MNNLEDKNFVDNILQQIKEKNILPKAKWRFLLKNYLIWLLGLLSLIFGAISTSLIFYMLSDSGYPIGVRFPKSFEAVFFVIPFFWIICLIVFALSVYYYIKHTKNGYRYSTKVIILLTILFSLFLGILFNIFGLDRRIDDTLGRRAPFYDQVINPQIHYWSNPKAGRLTGLIIDKQNNYSYDLVDRDGKVWIILASDEEYNDKIEVGRPIRALGKIKEVNVFEIEELIPFGPGKGFFKRPKHFNNPKFCPDGEIPPCLPMMMP